jgi:hypothetical protein
LIWSLKNFNFGKILIFTDSVEALNLLGFWDSGCFPLINLICVSTLKFITYRPEYLSCLLVLLSHCQVFVSGGLYAGNFIYYCLVSDQDIYFEACYRLAQTFKQPNIQIFKHLGVLGQTWFLLRI